MAAPFTLRVAALTFPLLFDSCHHLVQSVLNIFYHFNRYEVVSPGFNVHFKTGNIEHLFMCIFVIHISMVMCLFKFPANFLSWVAFLIFEFGELFVNSRYKSSDESSSHAWSFLLGCHTL